MARAEGGGEMAPTDRDGGAVDGFWLMDGQLHAFPWPRLPDGHEFGVTGFESGGDSREGDIPDGRGGELPALHPGIVGASGEFEGGVHGEAAFPRERFFLGAEADLDPAVFDHGIGREDIFPG